MINDLLTNRVLTQDQFDAVVDPASEVLCLACAGSGKSRTLAFRIARLIQEGNPPQSIVAFTFTEKAAESIKRRVADAMEKCGFPVAYVGAMYIGTIHAYCQNLLGEMNAAYRQFEVLDENRLKLFLLSRYYELNLQSLQRSRNVRMFQVIAEISNAWQMANDEILHLEDIEVQDFVLGSCLKSVRARLIKDQYLDFSLMIRLIVDALAADTAEINQALKNIKHLMVDEYQDVNPVQEALIAGIYRKIQSLFVVGDDDQSIYAWRGADVQNIIEFEQRYPNSTRHTLSTNFRSTEEIVHASDQFIQLVLGPARIEKQPLSNSNGNVKHFANLWFASRQEEAVWIAARINRLLGTAYEDGGEMRGLTLSDFAILMRSVQGGTRNGGDPNHREFTTALQNAGIPYLIEGESSIFERPHASAIRGAMELLRKPGPGRTTVVNFFKDDIVPAFPNADLNKFISILSDWNNQIHRPAGGARRKVYPQLLVHELLEAFNVSTTEFANPDQIMRDLGVFSGIILDIEKVFISIDSEGRYQAILNFLSNVAESGYDTSAVELMSRPNAVTISTVHKMKGLEYPVVFIVDLVNQRFPGNRSNYSGWLPQALIQNTLSRGLYQTDIPNEARLFYTALTRAERFLYLTGSANHPNLKRPKQQSQFKLYIAGLNRPDIYADPNHLPANLETHPERMRIDEESMPTSFTEIKDYLECPMRYKFRKIYGFSPAVPELFGFGLTTHTAISRLHQTFPDTAPTKADAEAVTEDVFHLKHVFKSEKSGARGPYENAKNASKRIVSDYAVNYPSDFTRSRSLEQRFEIKADKALITGSIDLLLKEDPSGQIIEAKVIDFKSMDYPEKHRNPFFWINLSLQVQLYAYAAEIVLGENAKTGAVHLLKEKYDAQNPNRIDVPIDDEALEAAIENIKWGVNRILEHDFPMRPSSSKCGECDFNKICPKNPGNFSNSGVPPPIHIPEVEGVDQILVRCFSDIN